MKRHWTSSETLVTLVRTPLAIVPCTHGERATACCQIYFALELLLTHFQGRAWQHGRQSHTSKRQTVELQRTICSSLGLLPSEFPSQREAHKTIRSVGSESRARAMSKKLPKISFFASARQLLKLLNDEPFPC